MPATPPFNVSTLTAHCIVNVPSIDLLLNDNNRSSLPLSIPSTPTLTAQKLTDTFSPNIETLFWLASTQARACRNFHHTILQSEKGNFHKNDCSKTFKSHTSKSSPKTPLFQLIVMHTVPWRRHLLILAQLVGPVFSVHKHCGFP